MKQLFVILLITSISVNAQEEDVVCFVTSVKGNVEYGQGKKLKVGDTLRYRNRHNIVFLSKGAVTFFSKAGSTRLYSKEKRNQHGETFFEFVQDVLRVHSREVPMSSRGDCDCVLPQCFSTDPAMNERILLVDTLSFAASNDMPADSSFYFLQWKAGETLYNKRLTQHNGTVYITPSELHFYVQDYTVESGEPLKLGLYRYINNEKKASIVTSFKVETLLPSALLNYYETLRKVMGNVPNEEVLKALYADLYVYFGKPDLCRLKRLINYKE